MDMFLILLIIHITSGIIGFIVAPIVLIAKKGGKTHRLWGKVFFWSMTSVALTAVIMAPMHNNMFLTLVAVFSFYLSFSGYRALYRKNAYKTKKTAFIDWFFASVNTLFSFSLIIFGVLQLPGAFGIISIVFGSLGTALGLKDIISFVRPSPDKANWFFSHMTGMIASYIAALSAFSAVNFNFDWLPTAIQWLWPTLIGVPLMRRWIMSYKQKFSRGRKISEEVVLRNKE
jgi:uncharacterized membrane protein